MRLLTTSLRGVGGFVNQSNLPAETLCKCRSSCLAHAIGVKGQHDREASSEGGVCVMEAEPEIGGEWWVHSGNVVASYLEVTAGFTNKSDLLQYLHSLFHTETYIASFLMNPDSLFEGSMVGGWWMGVPVALPGVVMEAEKYGFSFTINLSLSKHTGTRTWLSGISGLPNDSTASIIHPAVLQPDLRRPPEHHYRLHNRACTLTGLTKPTLKVCAKRLSARTAEGLSGTVVIATWVSHIPQNRSVLMWRTINEYFLRLFLFMSLISLWHLKCEAKWICFIWIIMYYISQISLVKIHNTFWVYCLKCKSNTPLNDNPGTGEDNFVHFIK